MELIKLIKHTVLMLYMKLCTNKLLLLSALIFFICAGPKKTYKYQSRFHTI